MTTQHTPGPWRVDVAQDSDGTICSVDVREAAYGLFVAAIEAHTDEHADVMANARLIASAPDLLAALRSVTETLHTFVEQAERDAAKLHMSVHGRTLAGMAESGKLCLATARAAIARVEGKS